MTEAAVGVAEYGARRAADVAAWLERESDEIPGHAPRRHGVWRLRAGHAAALSRSFLRLLAKASDLLEGQASVSTAFVTGGDRGPGQDSFNFLHRSDPLDD